jgi:hypothetical protein
MRWGGDVRLPEIDRVAGLERTVEIEYVNIWIAGST